MEVEVKGKSWSRGGQEEGVSLSDVDWLRSESVFVLCGAVLDIKEAHFSE